MSASSDKAPFDVAAFARNFDHHAVEFGEHLNDILSHMRDKCPVAHTEAYGGFWVLTRYRDIVKVARDDQTFSLKAGMSIPPFRQEGDPPFVLPGDLDPPASFVYRRLVEPVVTVEALAALEPGLRRTARELVDGFIEKGEADLVQDFAAPLTAIATMRLSGLPEADWPRYVAERRVAASAAKRDPEEEMRLIGERFAWTCDAFREQIKIQRSRPIEGGLIARLLAARIDDQAVGKARPLEEWEMVAILINFVTGGLETTQALLGSAWVHLGRHPDQRADLTDNLGLMTGAVEEMLRYFAPQAGLARVATADTEVGGTSLNSGERVFMCWASANRDQDVFERPDVFDIRRRPNRHLTFGVGAHHCLGANVTRLEARICMEEVLRRLPDYALVEAGLEPIPDVATVSGYLSVPVTFEPGLKAD